MACKFTLPANSRIGSEDVGPMFTWLFCMEYAINGCLLYYLETPIFAANYALSVRVWFFILLSRVPHTDTALLVLQLLDTDGIHPEDT